MNIEFLDEAGTGLSPWVRRESHWQEGDHSDLAELHCSRLSSEFSAVIADRGLWATAGFKARLSCRNAPTPNSQLLFAEVPGCLVWVFPQMDRVAEPLPALAPLPELTFLNVPIFTL